MANEAKFTINGTPSEDPTTGDKKFIATNSQTLSVTLEENPSAALSVQYEVYDPTDSNSPLASKDAPLLTWVGSGSSKQTFVNVNDTAQIIMPASGSHSYFIRCRANTPDSGDIFERAVSVLTATGTSPELRKTVPAETTQARQRGFSDDLNEMVEHVAALGSGPGTGDVVGTPPSVTDAIARFSNTTAKLIKNSPILIKDDTGFTAEIQFFVGTRDPNGNVTGNPGDVYYRDNGTSSTVYIHQGASTSNNDWTPIGGVGVTGPVSSVVNAVALWNDTTGDTLKNSNLSVADDTGFTATSIMYIGTRSPAGNISGNPGDIYVRADAGVNSQIYIHQGSGASTSDWHSVVTGPTTSTDDGIPAFDGTDGNKLQDTKHRIYYDSDSRTIDARDPNDTQNINVAYLERTTANGLPADLWTILGDANARTGIRAASGGNKLFVQESNLLTATQYKIIYENVSSGWKVNNSGVIATQLGDTTAPLTLDNDGTNGADSRIFVGNRTPISNVTGNPGDIYIRSDDGTSSTIYFHQGSSSDNTSWVDISAAPSSPGSAFWAYLSGDKGSILSGSQLTVDFDSTNYNDGSDYSTGSAYYVAPSNGYYTFSADIGITVTAAATQLECRLTQGSTIIARNSRACSGSGTFYVSTSCNGIKLSTNDLIRCRVFQNSGSTATIESDDTNFIGCQLWEI